MFSVCPGLSGGLLAIRLGDYNRIINTISNKEFNKSNLIYLFQIVFGFIFGTILFSNIINYLCSTYYSFFNIIVVLISIYLLVSIILKSKIKLLNLFILILVSICLVYLLKTLPGVSLNGWFLYLISGFLFSLSKLIPGLSASILLVNIGFYEYLLLLFSNPLIIIYNFGLWVIFWVSFTLSSLMVIKYVCNKGQILYYLVIIIMLINIILMFE